MHRRPLGTRRHGDRDRSDSDGHVHGFASHGRRKRNRQINITSRQSCTGHVTAEGSQIHLRKKPGLRVSSSFLRFLSQRRRTPGRRADVAGTALNSLSADSETRIASLSLPSRRCITRTACHLLRGTYAQTSEQRRQSAGRTDIAPRLRSRGIKRAARICAAQPDARQRSRCSGCGSGCAQSC